MMEQDASIFRVEEVSVEKSHSDTGKEDHYQTVRLKSDSM